MDPRQPNIEESSVGSADSGPTITLPKGRLVKLSLAASPQEAACPFWIGLAASGSRSPSALMDQPEITALLTEAATAGVSERGPLMLTDTSVEPPRYVFLMPKPSSDFRERTQWIHDLISSLSAWAPEEVGLYIAPEAMASDSGLDLLLEVLRAAVPQLPATRCYHLLTGGYGINTVMNGLLRLKAEMDGEELNLYVYH